MKNLLLFAAISVLTFASCSKDNNDTPNCPVTMEGLAGSYKLTGLTYKNAAGEQTDWYTTTVQACKKDDIYNLGATGTFSIQDAGTVCSPDGSYNNGAWTLTGNEINMDGFYYGTVQSFDCKTLVFYSTDVLDPGDKLTATFTKQ